MLLCCVKLEKNQQSVMVCVFDDKKKNDHQCIITEFCAVLSIILNWTLEIVFYQH